MVSLDFTCSCCTRLRGRLYINSVVTSLPDAETHEGLEASILAHVLRRAGDASDHVTVRFDHAAQLGLDLIARVGQQLLVVLLHFLCKSSQASCRVPAASHTIMQVQDNQQAMSAIFAHM